MEKRSSQFQYSREDDVAWEGSVSSPPAGTEHALRVVYQNMTAAVLDRVLGEG